MKNVVFCLALAVTSAQAGLIVGTQNTDLTAYGFGAAPSILTLQRDALEMGCVSPTNSAPGHSTACQVNQTGFIDLANSLVSGSNKYVTPTLTSLGVTSFSTLAILFNINEPNNVREVTLQNLMLTLYGGAGGITPIYDFGLNDADGSGPTDFIDIAQGQGSAGFVIRIAAAEWAGKTFDGAMRVGLSAKIGCTLATGCDVAGKFGTGGGPESFTIVNLEGGVTRPQEIVPEPASAALMGGGLILLSWILRRRRAS